MPRQLSIADLTPQSHNWQLRGTVTSVIPTRVSASGCPYMSFFLKDNNSQIRVVAFRDVASVIEERVAPDEPCVVTSHNGARVKWNDHLAALEIIVNRASALAVLLSPPASPGALLEGTAQSPLPPQFKAKPAKFRAVRSPGPADPLATPTPLHNSQLAQDREPSFSQHDPHAVSGVSHEAFSSADQAPTAAEPHHTLRANGQRVASSHALVSTQGQSAVQAMSPTDAIAPLPSVLQSRASNAPPPVESQLQASSSPASQQAMSPPFGPQSSVSEWSFPQSGGVLPSQSRSSRSYNQPSRAGSGPHQLPIVELTLRSSNWQVRGSVTAVEPTQIGASGCPYMSFYLEDDSASIRVVSFRDVTYDVEELAVSGETRTVTACNGARVNWNSRLKANQIVIDRASAIAIEASATDSPLFPASVQPAPGPSLTAISSSPAVHEPPAQPTLVSQSLSPALAPSPAQSSSLALGSPPAMASSPAQSSSFALASPPGPASSAPMGLSSAPASQLATVSSPAPAPSFVSESPPALRPRALETYTQDSQNLGPRSSPPGMHYTSGIAHAAPSPAVQAPPDSVLLSVLPDDGQLHTIGTDATATAHAQPVTSTFFRSRLTPTQPLTLRQSQQIESESSHVYPLPESNPMASYFSASPGIAWRPSQIKQIFSPRGSELPATTLRPSVLQLAPTPAESQPSGSQSPASRLHAHQLPILEPSESESSAPRQLASEESDRPAWAFGPLSWLSRLFPWHRSRDSSTSMRSSNHVPSRVSAGGSR